MFRKLGFVQPGRVPRRLFGKRPFLEHGRSDLGQLFQLLIGAGAAGQLESMTVGGKEIDRLNDTVIGNAHHIQSLGFQFFLCRLYSIEILELEGYVLNPGKVPFHRPGLANGEYSRAWWDENSAEDIYQRNKVLLVNPEALRVRIMVVSHMGSLFKAQENCVASFQE